jgi:hypothetical protein
MAEMKWHDWGPVREHLRTWGASLLRGRRYTVTVDPRSVRTGVCHFTHRAIKVNPEGFGLTDAEQYGCAKALLAHEAGHAWHTDEGALGGDDTGTHDKRSRTILDRLVNILEDERVERCMMNHFVLCRRLFGLLGDVAYRDSHPLPSDDDPRAVIGACLLWRWAHDRAEQDQAKIQDALSGANLALWDQVSPLVEEAWVAQSTLQVVAFAREILAILAIPEDDPETPDWLKELLDLLGQLVGQRGPGDGVEEGLPVPLPVPGDGGEHGAPDSGELGDELGDLLGFLRRQGGTGGGELPIEPAPYLELQGRCRPWADQLVAAMQVPEPEVEPDFGSRGRVQIRAAIRDPMAPMREPVDTGREVPRAAFEILQDRSGSMSPIIRYSQEGLMTVHLALSQLGIPHAITAFEGCVVVKEYGDTTPMPRALIAGLTARTGTTVGPTLLLRGEVLLARLELIKLLLIIHDGFPFDPEVIEGWIGNHPQVFTVGVYLGDDAEDIAAMTELFGRQRLIACLPLEFPARLAQFVRGITPRGH